MEKDRRIHLGVDELSDELIKFAEEEFGVSRETLFSLEEDEKMRQKLLDIWVQIETDELPEDDSPVPEYVRKVSELLDAICYHPYHLLKRSEVVASPEQKEELRSLLTPYINLYEEKNDAVLEEDVDDLIMMADGDGIVQEMTDYIKANPGIFFWKLFEMLKPGISDDVDLEDLMGE